MGKIAFVFSGQGAQYPGMGKSLYACSAAARSVFDQAEAIREGIKSLCFSGSPEDLKRTDNTQPCLYCVDLAAAAALREAGVPCDMAAGFSLGELAALSFCGAVSPADGFRMVLRRGALMQEASEAAGSAMAAVQKLPNQTVEALCARYQAIYPSNYNCPGQLVVAGGRSEIRPFLKEVREAGGRGVLLPVSGGFHSPFMADAAKQFASSLSEFAIGAPSIPLFSNYTAQPYDGDPKELLARQIENPVRWQETIEHMIARGADTFIEVGPGKTLQGLISRISDKVTAYHAEDEETLSSTIQAVKEHA
ncbi:MAG: ACP S-malonyltransferase [Oscillospiraceae bacterium]|nr:ACP S-malonyltransferase [Oscillospiraceae bacterium]